MCSIKKRPNFLEFEQTIRQLFEAQLAAVRSENVAQLAERRDSMHSDTHIPARFGLEALERYIRRTASRSSIFRIFCWWYINQGRQQCAANLLGMRRSLTVLDRALSVTRCAAVRSLLPNRVQTWDSSFYIASKAQRSIAAEPFVDSISPF